ncbi:MAG: PEPxxWA-CTERM sorting domain-containing protein [Polymorphobacter sp.]
MQPIGFALAVLALALPARASTNLIVNSGFETGTLAGWNSQAHTQRDGLVCNCVIVNGAAVPISHNPTMFNPAGGRFAAVTDQDYFSVQAVYQRFHSNGGRLVLSFDWFDNTHEPQTGPEFWNDQMARIDIMYDFPELDDPTAYNFDAFNTDTLVERNLMLNAGTLTAFGTAIPWQSSRFVLDGLPAGNYVLRFGSSQSTGYQQFGIDNVVLQAVPEPAAWALMITGFALTGGALRRRRQTLPGKSA